MAIEFTDDTIVAAESDSSRSLQNKHHIQDQDQDHSSNRQLIIEQTEDPVDDSELHFDVDKGDVIFDYGTQEITATPDLIGEHISQILESVLPTGLQRETRGKLQAVVNNNNQPIEPANGESLLELQDAMGNLQKIQKVKQLRRHTSDSRKANEDNDSETSLAPCRHNDNSLSNKSNRPSRPSRPSRPPNFSVLIREKAPVCLFCEYCMVFGEPPHNMIKWYNKVNRYNNLPREGERKNKHSRKKSR